MEKKSVDAEGDESGENGERVGEAARHELIECGENRGRAEWKSERECRELSADGVRERHA